QVLDRDVALVRDDLRSPVVTVLLGDLQQLGADDLPLPLRLVQDVLQVGDLRLEFGQLVEDALPFQCGELAQLHVEDGRGLDLVDVQQLHQTRARLVRVRRTTDQLDHGVEVVECLGQSTEDVSALLGLTQPVAGTPDDDIDLVVDVMPHHLVEPEGARHTVHQREHVDAEVVLQLGVLVEVVQHHLRHRVTFQRDHDAHAAPAVALVGDVRDAGDLAVPRQRRDVLHQVVRVHLVRQLGDDEGGPPLGVLLDLHHGAHPDGPTARAVGVGDALRAEDLAARREVRALDALHQGGERLLLVGVRVVQRPDHAVDDLAQVVWRDVGRHPDGDPRTTVDQQVRDTTRQNVRFLRTPVVVVGEIDRVFLDVPQHLHRERVEACLGVPHGGRRVVTGRAEVALAVDRRVPHRPPLGQSYQRVGDRRVTVRVVVTHHVADDPGALVVAAVGPEPGVVHRVQDTAVHRLQPVTHVRQSPRHNHAHRVIDVGVLHLLLDVDGLDTASGVGRQSFGHDSEVPFTWLDVGTRSGPPRRPGTAHPWRYG